MNKQDRVQNSAANIITGLDEAFCRNVAAVAAVAEPCTIVNGTDTAWIATVSTAAGRQSPVRWHGSC